MSLPSLEKLFFISVTLW